MLDDYKYTVASRFLKYVTIDTQSDPASGTRPSTLKQLELSRLLVSELLAMGIADAHLDEFGYVYATIPSNSHKKVPVICFCAHVDTSPDCSGQHVRPLVHENYDGNDIHLPDDPAQVISVREHPYLQQKKGEDIITASGTTLLGADDKAGIAVIMDMANFLVTHPGIKHGTLKLLFTPDEEIGSGVDNVDIAKLGADFGYTLDGSELGSFEQETFSADGVRITIHGVSTHPGDAKNKMVNALKIASAYIERLPKDSYSPETTSGSEGFFHPVKITGTVEQASMEFIVRDFHTHKLAQYENFLKDLLDEVLRLYPGATAHFEVHEQYRNMKEVLDRYPMVGENARKAIQRAGIPVKESSARGGTDGSRLSFMGLPCPNLFTGEMAFHGKHEYVSIQDMQKSVETIIHLAMIWEEGAEELVFRGYVLKNLMKSFNNGLALFISAVLFTAVHLSNPGIPLVGIINTFLGGLLTGLTYMYMRNLWLPVFFHFTWNFMQGPVLGYEVSGLPFGSMLIMENKTDDLLNGGDYGFEGSLICTLLLVLAVAAFGYAEARRRMHVKQAEH